MTRKIATNQAAVACAVCGRTLLRGEESDIFLAGGSRRNVCQLCTQRAAREGWIREGIGEDQLGVREGRRERGSSLLGRIGRRREAAAASSRGELSAADEPLEAPVLPYTQGSEPVYVAEVAPAVAPPPPDEVELVDRSRTVRAVPTNADMKRARAMEVFNVSAHPRTVAGVARSLGAPFVVVRPSETEGSMVSIVVGWELCWYRYEIDLADEAAGVRVAAQGAELSELDASDQLPNAAADEHGELQLADMAQR